MNMNIKRKSKLKTVFYGGFRAQRPLMKKKHSSFISVLIISNLLRIYFITFFKNHEKKRIFMLLKFGNPERGNCSLPTPTPFTLEAYCLNCTKNYNVLYIKKRGGYQIKMLVKIINLTWEESETETWLACGGAEELMK